MQTGLCWLSCSWASLLRARWPGLCSACSLSPWSWPLPAQPEAGTQLLWGLRPSYVVFTSNSRFSEHYPRGRTSIPKCQPINIVQFPCLNPSRGSTSLTRSNPNSFLYSSQGAQPNTHTNPRCPHSPDKSFMLRVNSPSPQVDFPHLRLADSYSAFTTRPHCHA